MLILKRNKTKKITENSIQNKKKEINYPTTKCYAKWMDFPGTITIIYIRGTPKYNNNSNNNKTDKMVSMFVNKQTKQNKTKKL